MSDKTDPRLNVLRGSLRYHLDEAEVAATLDAADRAAGIVRVDTRDEALVERLAQAMYAHPGGEFPAWRLVGNDIKDLYRAEARAVLAVLREES